MQKSPIISQPEKKLISKQAVPYEDKDLYDKIVARADETFDYFTKIGVYKNIEKYMKYYSNEFWRGKTRPDHLSKISLNDLFEVIEVSLPIVTARIPRANVKALPARDQIESLEEGFLNVKTEDQYEALKKAEKEYYEDLNKYGENIEKELQAIWKRTKMTEKMQIMYRTEFGVKGKGHIKSIYNSSTKKWSNTIAPYSTILPCKTAASIDDCYDTWFTQQMILPVSLVEETYGMKVPAEGELTSDGSFRAYNDDELEKYKNTGSVRIIETFFKDTSLEEFEKIETDDEQNIQYDEFEKPVKTIESRPAYEGLRKVTICRSCEGWLIEDTNVNKIPIFEVTNYPQEGKYWGTSEGRNIEDHITAKNYLWSNIIDNARLTGNPQKAKGSDVEEAITNEPGKVYTEEVLNSIRNIDPPSMPAYIQNALAYLDADEDKKSGVNDALRAQAQQGDSGTKVKALYSQAQGRLQPKIMAFKNLARELYEYWATIIQQNYEAPLIHEKETADGEKGYASFDPKKHKDIELVVEVDESSMIPVDSYGEFEEGQLLFEIGLISGEQLIDLAPTLQDKERAKRYLKEQKEQQEQIQEKQFIVSECIGAIESMVMAMESMESETPAPDAQNILNKSLERLVQLVNNLPELIDLNEFKSLSPQIKIAVMQKVFEDDEMQIATENAQKDMQKENAN